MIPPAFSAPKVLRRLNMIAVGLSLAAATAAAFSILDKGFSGLVTGAPTLVFGVIWAWLLRIPNTIGSSKVRWAWLASVPLAAINAGFSAGLLFATDNGKSFEIMTFFGGMALGATFGIFLWAPALVATLVAFGLPIAMSQSLAKKGLAGEERGEKIVGVVCAVLAMLGLAMSFVHVPDNPGSEHLFHNRASLLWGGMVFTRVVAVLGALAGGAAAVLASAREQKRKAFVADAEQGKVPGFRVDATPEGKALVRVSSLGQGYRVADFTEEVFLLDEEGQATESRIAAARE